VIPVILTHRGNQDYVRTAIEQAQLRNQRVILIGDEGNMAAEHYLNADYWEGAAEFAKVYKHMSHNPEPQELYCFQIYFVLRDFCRRNHIERLFTMDSDVMLYCDVTEYEKTLGDYDLAINWCERQEPYRWSACLHNSFWKYWALAVMCDLITGTYQSEPLMNKLEQKWAWHEENNVPGGVCDMTLLHFFRQEMNAVNLSRVRATDGYINPSVWDDNINQAENYTEGEYWEWTALGGGKVIWRGSELKGRTAPFYLERGFPPEYIRANALHFQGQAKRLMEEYRG